MGVPFRRGSAAVIWLLWPPEESGQQGQVTMTANLKEQIAKAAEVLKSFGAKEVYLFGSAATGQMDDHSDIDLAVTGLPPEVFFRAYSKATAEIPRREVDLVDLDQENAFSQYLRREGELRRL